jgi:hypothetical protein
MQTKTTTHSAAPKPQDSAENTQNLEERLRRIEAGIADIQEHTHKKEQQKKSDGKKASRTAVTAGFAFLGFKLFALIGGQIGLIKGAVEEVRDTSPTLVKKQYDSETKNLTGDNLVRKTAHYLIDLVLHSNHLARQFFIAGTISGLAGAIIGGVIGWTRGDRIENPYDLIKHPAESMKKIFGHKPPQKLPEPPVKSEIPATEEKNTRWAEKMEMLAQQKQA